MSSDRRNLAKTLVYNTENTDLMSKRKKRLDQLGGKKMGGMFDIIFRKRKEREKVLSEIEY